MRCNILLPRKDRPDLTNEVINIRTFVLVNSHNLSAGSLVRYEQFVKSYEDVAALSLIRSDNLSPRLSNKYQHHQLYMATYFTTY